MLFTVGSGLHCGLRWDRKFGYNLDQLIDVLETRMWHNFTFLASSDVWILFACFPFKLSFVWFRSEKTFPPVKNLVLGAGQNLTNGRLNPYPAVFTFKEI